MRVPAPAREVLRLPEKPSIAILPFANLSGDPAQDYLAEGLRLDIQATLVHASGLFLIAPATVARYRGGRSQPSWPDARWASATF